jgi:group I intron endonuclease
MYYTIYEIKNNINDKIYVGKHQTAVINDRYFGSGIVLKEAIKKYGKENFTKTVLYVFETEEEMNSKEKEIVTEEFIYRKDTYNIGVGGKGGPQFLGHKHTEATKQKLREIGLNRPPPTDDVKRRISETQIGKVVSDETKEKLSVKRKERVITDETKEKTANSLREFYKHNKKLVSDETRKKMSNKIWIKNLSINKSMKINPELFEEYKLKGFVRGRIL